MPGMENEQNTPSPQPTLQVVLASGSPRRRELLRDAGVKFIVRPSEIQEKLTVDQLADPPATAQKLAEQKAGAVVQELLAEGCEGMVMVIGADTIVVCEGEIFGKPRNLDDGKRMLRRLSGITHQVMTGVSVWLISAIDPQSVSVGYRNFVDESDVTFRELTEEEIADYLRKGESFDKAGAYAIQGEGAQLVAGVRGEMDTVIGLPVTRLLKEFPELRLAK